MQKILIVSPKAILLQNFDGGQVRIFDIAKFLSKKNKIDFVCTSNNVLEKKGNLSFFNKIVVFQISFISRIFNIIICILKLQPFLFINFVVLYIFIKININLVYD